MSVSISESLSINNTQINNIQQVFIEVKSNVDEEKANMSKKLGTLGMELGTKISSGLQKSLKIGISGIGSQLLSSNESLGELKTGFETLFTQIAQGKDTTSTLEGIKSSAKDFATSLVEGLSNISSQLPAIIDSLVPFFAQLIQEFGPTLIPLLVQTFTGIFGAIVDNFPLLINSIISLLPTLAMSIVDGFWAADIGGKIAMAIMGGFMAFGLFAKVKAALDFLKNVNVGGAAAGAGGAGIGATLQGLAKGLAAFANPQILLGAAILSGAMIALSAGVWASIQIIADALPKLGTALQSFNEVNGLNLLAVGTGLAALGLGLAAITAGSIIDGIAKLFGGGFEQALKGIIEPIMNLMPNISAEDIAKFSLLGSGLLALGFGFEKIKGFTNGEAIATSIKAINTAVVDSNNTGTLEMYQGLSTKLGILANGLMKLSTIQLNMEGIVAFLTQVNNKIATLNNFDWAGTVVKMRTKGDEIGRAVAQGIQTGINNNAFLFIDAIGKKVDEMIAEAKRKADINSPSKRMEKEFGAMIMAGAQKGIDKKSLIIPFINDQSSKAMAISALSAITEQKPLELPSSAIAMKKSSSTMELPTTSVSFPSELKIIDNDGIIMRVKPVIDEKVLRNNIDLKLI